MLLCDLVEFFSTFSKFYFFGSIYHNLTKKYGWRPSWINDGHACWHRLHVQIFICLNISQIVIRFFSFLCLIMCLYRLGIDWNIPKHYRVKINTPKMTYFICISWTYIRTQIVTRLNPCTINASPQFAHLTLTLILTNCPSNRTGRCN